MTTLSATSTAVRRIEGYTTPNAHIVARNVSLAPYAPDSDSLRIIGKADSKGRFVLTGPALVSGTLVRVEGETGDIVDVRIAGKIRRPEAEVQGLRLYCKAGVGRFENVLSRERIADPGARLRFTNVTTGDEVEVKLDRDGKLPKGTTIDASIGDQIDIHVAPGGSSKFPAKKWASLIAQSESKKRTSAPAANGSTVTGTKTLTDMYIDGVTRDDPKQGDVGDCWIIATLAAMAHTASSKVTNMIKHDEDAGTATVTLHRWDRKKRGFVGEDIEVKTSFYKNDDGLVYGYSEDDGEAWVSTIEKAYAQWKGGYEASAVGYPYAAFEALLGRRGEQIFLDIEDDDAAFKKLSASTSRPTVAVTVPGPAKEMERAGLVEDHAYTVLDAYTRGGERYVKVRNPWGKFEPKGNGKDDGEFEMSFADFKQRFVYACQA